MELPNVETKVQTQMSTNTAGGDRVGERSTTTTTITAKTANENKTPSIPKKTSRESDSAPVVPDLPKKNPQPLVVDDSVPETPDTLPDLNPIPTQPPVPVDPPPEIPDTSTSKTDDTPSHTSTSTSTSTSTDDNRSEPVMSTIITINPSSSKFPFSDVGTDEIPSSLSSFLPLSSEDESSIQYLRSLTSSMFLHSAPSSPGKTKIPSPSSQSTLKKYVDHIYDILHPHGDNNDWEGKTWKRTIKTLWSTFMKELASDVQSDAKPHNNNYKDSPFGSGNFTVAVVDYSNRVEGGGGRSVSYGISSLISTFFPRSIIICLGCGGDGESSGGFDRKSARKFIQSHTNIITSSPSTTSSSLPPHSTLLTTYAIIPTLHGLCHNLLPYECEGRMARMVKNSETVILPAEEKEEEGKEMLRTTGTTAVSEYFDWWDDGVVGMLETAIMSSGLSGRADDEDASEEDKSNTESDKHDKKSTPPPVEVTKFHRTTYTTTNNDGEEAEHDDSVRWSKIKWSQGLRWSNRLCRWGCSDEGTILASPPSRSRSSSSSYGNAAGVDLGAVLDPSFALDAYYSSRIYAAMIRDGCVTPLDKGSSTVPVVGTGYVFSHDRVYCPSGSISRVTDGKGGKRMHDADDIQTVQKPFVDTWSPHLLSTLLQTFPPTSSPTIIVTGHSTSLTSAKLSSHLPPTSTILTLLEYDKIYSPQLTHLSRHMGSQGVWALTHAGHLPNMAFDRGVDSLGKMGEVLDATVQGPDAILHAVYTYAAGRNDGGTTTCEERGDALMRSIARYATGAANFNFIVVPAMGNIVDGLRSVGVGSENADRRRYHCQDELLDMVGGSLSVEGTVELLRKSIESQGLSSLGSVTISYVSYDKSTDSALVKISPSTSKQTQQGVSIYTMSRLGMSATPDTARRAARYFLQLEVNNDDTKRKKNNNAFTPWNLRIQGSKFVLPEPSASTISTPESLIFEQIKSSVLADVETSELSDCKFSFLEVGGGRIGTMCAEAFPHATVVSVLEDDDVARKVTDNIVKAEQWNHVLCTSGEKARVEDLAKHLYESPELMRYSYWDGIEVYEESSETNFGKIIGNLFSSSLTSFVRIPTARQVSLAHVLFFTPPAEPNDPKAKEVYQISAHPTKAFENFETLFLSAEFGEDSVEGYTRVKISNPVPDVPFVRVDVLNATRPVHHHYDFRKDGHKRTYTMHIEARDEGRLARDKVSNPMLADKNLHVNNGLTTTVFLTRDGDHHFIPYETIKSVTLIAVLRMGLTKELKKHAYKEFINMPLYEDMAPWNIVYDGKSLSYIDYDTRGKTFDAFVPHAYQVMSVLMNYKRTVRDFEHCGDKASTPYGFSFISDCVKGEFTGPCDDPAAVVACQTKVGSCQPDYISCLKAIVAEEEEEGDGQPGGNEGSKDSSSAENKEGGNNADLIEGYLKFGEFDK